jgi:hypothetical protein
MNTRDTCASDISGGQDEGENRKKKRGKKKAKERRKINPKYGLTHGSSVLNLPS